MKISKKQRNLLINSSVTHQFPWLYELLEKNEKVELQDVEIANQSDFENVIPFVLKQAGEEWKGNEELLYPVEDLGDKRIPCALCGTKNKIIYYIKNKVNGIKLNVGSDCINDFVEFEKEQYGKSRNQLIAEARKVRRMADVNKHFNGIDHIIDTWERKLEEYDVLIPNAIRKPYLLLLDNIKEKYNGYLNLKYNEGSFKDIEKMFLAYHRFISKMDEYEKLHKGDEFIVTKNIVRWLLRNNNNKDLLELLKETGYIDSRSIEFIFEKNFIKRIESNIVTLFEPLELDIEKINYEDELIIMSLNVYAGGIWISCSFKKIVDYFGALLFQEKSRAALTLKNLLKISTIYGNGAKEIVIQIIDDRFNYFGRKLQFRTHERSFIVNEVDIVDIENNRVLVYNLSSFLNEVKSYVIEEVTEEKVMEDEEYYLGLEGKRYSIQELRDIRGLDEVV